MLGVMEQPFADTAVAYVAMAECVGGQLDGDMRPFDGTLWRDDQAGGEASVTTVPWRRWDGAIVGKYVASNDLTWHWRRN